MSFLESVLLAPSCDYRCSNVPRMIPYAHYAPVPTRLCVLIDLLRPAWAPGHYSRHLLHSSIMLLCRLGCLSAASHSVARVCWYTTCFFLSTLHADHRAPENLPQYLCIFFPEFYILEMKYEVVLLDDEVWVEMRPPFAKSLQTPLRVPPSRGQPLPTPRWR